MTLLIPNVVYKCRFCKKGASLYKDYSKHKPHLYVCIRCIRNRDLKKQVWARLWILAEQNMPYMAKYFSFNQHVFRGRATALRMCLGYNTYSAKGRSNAQTALWVAIRRGSMPHSVARQNALRALAGPNGAVLARAKLIQLNQAHRFKYWPKGDKS